MSFNMYDTIAVDDKSYQVLQHFKDKGVDIDVDTKYNSLMNNGICRSYHL